MISITSSAFQISCCRRLTGVGYENELSYTYFCGGFNGSTFLDILTRAVSGCFLVLIATMLKQETICYHLAESGTPSPDNLRPLPGFSSSVSQQILGYWSVVFFSSDLYFKILIHCIYSLNIELSIQQLMSVRYFFGCHGGCIREQNTNFCL